MKDSPTLTNAQNRVYREVQDVAFFNGRFSVGIGLGTQRTGNLLTAIQDGEKLYLGIEVVDDQGRFVELSGRQVIESVPFAAWSASAADLSVGGQLTVAGDASIVGDADVTGNTSVGGNLDVTGQASANTANVGGQCTVGQLSVTGNASVSGNMTANTANVTGALTTQSETVQGDLRVNGTAYIRFLSLDVEPSPVCNTYFTGCNVMRGQNLEFLDRHPVSCGSSREYIVSWAVTGSGCSGDNMRIRSTCCKPNW